MIRQQLIEQLTREIMHYDGERSAVRRPDIRRSAPRRTWPGAIRRRDDLEAHLPQARHARTFIAAEHPSQLR